MIPSSFWTTTILHIGHHHLSGASYAVLVAGHLIALGGIALITGWCLRKLTTR